MSTLISCVKIKVASGVGALKQVIKSFVDSRTYIGNVIDINSPGSILFQRSRGCMHVVGWMVVPWQINYKNLLASTVLK